MCNMVFDVIETTEPPDAKTMFYSTRFILKDIILDNISKAALHLTKFNHRIN